MINEDDKHFMMIEPADKVVRPNDDHLTKLAHEVMRHARPTPGLGYRGFHVCCCGEISDNLEWKMPDGRLTNNLVVHYVSCHRQEIPRTEMAKLLCYASELSIPNIET